MSGRDEEFLFLADAVFQVTGQRRHLSTCIRWATQGVRGIKLRSWVIGSRRFTTLAAVREFVETLSGSAAVSRFADAVKSEDRDARESALIDLRDRGVDSAASLAKGGEK